MNNLTFNLSNIKETKTVINLPKQTLNWRRVIFFGGVLGIFSVSSSVLVSYLGPNFLYGEIVTLTLLIITTCGMIFGGYGLVNEIYKQPILVMTPSHIYIGLKILLRSPRIVDRGIMPKEVSSSIKKFPYGLYGAKTKTELCPPKPKELEIAALILCSR